jgi:predicted lipid-binding transport protein (Tim44 family)
MNSNFEGVVMNSKLRFLVVALMISAVVVPEYAQAKRMGSGSSSGMQRSLPARNAPEAVPAKPSQAAAPAPAAAPGAAAPKRSWMGPLAGLAAGLGLAALMGHLGLGAEFGNMIMLLLLGVLAFVAVRFAMKRWAPKLQPALATPGGMQFSSGVPEQAHISGGSGLSPQPVSSSVLSGSAGTGNPPPEGFDTAAFERLAKMIFIRLQAANDAADLNDLRTFTTPEMFASLRLELQERSTPAQQTDVVQVSAELLDFTTEAQRQVVSVRFEGLIREEAHGAAAPFNEIWHMTRPFDGHQEWAIAGIQQQV